MQNSTVVMAILEKASQLRKSKEEDEEVELEVRLGEMKDGVFTSGLNAITFSMFHSACFKSCSEHKENSGTFAAKGIVVPIYERTVEDVAQNCSNGTRLICREGQHKRWQKKERVLSCVMGPSNGIGAKVALSIEKDISEQEHIELQKRRWRTRDVFDVGGKYELHLTEVFDGREKTYEIELEVKEESMKIENSTSFLSKIENLLHFVLPKCDIGVQSCTPAHFIDETQPSSKKRVIDRPSPPRHRRHPPHALRPPRVPLPPPTTNPWSLAARRRP